MEEEGFHTNLTYSAHNFSNNCTCTYDNTGTCRQKPHMCTATSSKYICNFRLTDVFVSERGGLTDCRTFSDISLSHSSIAKGEPLYNEAIHAKFSNYYTDSTEKSGALVHSAVRSLKYKSYDMVVPTRMNWDDCFNHVSFQFIPFISYVMEFNADIWDTLTWHASLFTAGILRLLDIPKERIIVEEALFARSVLMPWVPHWCPLQVFLLLI